jgi:hypothetical protein
MKISLCAAVAVMAAITPARATQPQFINTADLLTAYDQGDASSRQLILLGLAQTEGGMELANIELQTRGNSPLYCRPAQLMLTGEQVLDMIRRYSAAHSDIRDSSYAVAILRAAEDAFPCTGK